MQELKTDHYFRSLANHARNWVKESQTYVRDKRIEDSHIKLEHMSIRHWDLGPKDIMNNIVYCGQYQ